MFCSRKVRACSASRGPSATQPSISLRFSSGIGSGESGEPASSTTPASLKSPERPDSVRAATSEATLPPMLCPTSSQRAAPCSRIARITAACRGFVYAASLMGTTGARDAVGSAAAGLVSRVRDVTRLPVAVGLGVRDGAQAAEVAGFADGVIVGSAFVQRLLAAPDTAAGLAAVRELTAELAAGVRAAAPARG